MSETTTTSAAERLAYERAADFIRRATVEFHKDVREGGVSRRVIGSKEVLALLDALADGVDSLKPTA